MKKKIVVRIFLVILLISTIIIIYLKNFEKETANKNETDQNETQSYNSNIIKDVNYVSKDAKGNEYIIYAKEGEIDLKDNNIIFLKNVNSLIKLNNSNNITITSDYGKHNVNNYDTIFSKNVVINYLENKITGEYLDFSLERNSMIVSRDIIYINSENILKADVIEVDIQTKDTKIYMYENNKKINIKSKN